MSRHVQVLRASDFDVKTGDKEYVIDLEDGDLQLDYLFYCDRPFQLYIGMGDKVIPLGAGFTMQGRLRIKDARWLMLKTEKTAQLACQVFAQTVAITERLDYTPLVVSIAPPPSVDMRAMVSRLVGQALEETHGRGKQEVEIDELVGDLPDDVDPEFGPGFMDLDEERTESYIHAVRERQRAPQKRDAKRADGGSEEEPGVKPDKKKDTPPKKEEKPEAA